MLALKRMFMNLKIQNKLFLVFGTFILMVASLIVFSFSEITMIEQDYKTLLEVPQQRLTHLSRASNELTDVRRYALSMAHTTNNDSLVRYFYQKYQSAAGKFTRHMENYHTNMASDRSLPPEETQALGERVSYISREFDRYMTYVEDCYRAFLRNDRGFIVDMVLGGMRLGDNISGVMDSLREQVFDRVTQRSAELERGTKSAKNTVIIFSVGILALALLVAVSMPRTFKSPIVKMQTAMEEIAKGNLTYPIRSGLKDELGELSNSIGNMVDTIAALNKHVTIMDNLDSTVCVTDLDLNIIFLNQSIADFYGIDKETSLGKKCYDVFYRQDTLCDFCPLPNLLPRKESLPSCEWEHHMEDRNLWIARRTSIIRWMDGSLAHVCIGRDNTLKRQHEQNQALYTENMRKVAEAAKEASRAKSVFLATMSHEIRTPMNGIIGFSELALADDIPAKTRGYLDKIKTSSEGLLRIINDILDISKIEAGKVALENIPFDIHEVLKSCQEIITPKALEKGITLFCYTEPSIHGKLLGDPTRLRQALLNLLSNAVKFTHTGIVKFLTSIASAGSDAVAIHFEVKDSGIGMTDEQIKRIFDQFTQGDNTMTRKYGGTGLGLAITKSIVELMGGTLAVESAQGVGSKFSFDITFKTIGSDIAELPHESSIRILEKPTFAGTVLICEDNEMNQLVICDHLARVGIGTVVASNGREAVDIVQQRTDEGRPPFDLIFMDVHMPVMDGLDASKLLTQMGNKTPVVALTANIMPNDREVYREAGMPDCLAKPFTTHELWACLLKYFTPLSTFAVDERDQLLADEKMHHQLRKNFWEDNKTTFRDLSDALLAGDIKRAHRIAHTLKGVAGLIGKNSLKESAFAVEQALRYGKADAKPEQLSRLENELSLVMSEFAHMFAGHEQDPGDTNGEAPDRARALELLNRLEPMFKVGNSDCLESISDLRAIPGTENLIERMEHFDFAAAHDILSGIKEKWEGS